MNSWYIAALLTHHPAPWKIEWDWRHSIVDANGEQVGSQIVDLNDALNIVNAANAHQLESDRLLDELFKT